VCREVVDSLLTALVGLIKIARSSNEDAGTTGFLNSLLSGLGEELGLDDHGDLGEGTLAEDLEKALRDAKNDI
jgi:hypothetical protein